MKYLPFIQRVLSYLIVAILFMLIGAFMQWSNDTFFEDVEVTRRGQ